MPIGPPTMIKGIVARLARVPRVAPRAAWQAATWPISWAMTPANSDSSSAARMAPVFTYMYPPGSVKALGDSSSRTLMMKGTLASELRTIFCPMRLMYSVTLGSVMSFELASTCRENSWPIATCLSSVYQLAKPRSQPTLRCPMAFTLLMPSLWENASSSLSFDLLDCSSDDCANERPATNISVQDRNAILRNTIHLLLQNPAISFRGGHSFRVSIG